MPGARGDSYITHDSLIGALGDGVQLHGHPNSGAFPIIGGHMERMVTATATTSGSIVPREATYGASGGLATPTMAINYEERPPARVYAARDLVPH